MNMLIMTSLPPSDFTYVVMFPQTKTAFKELFIHIYLAAILVSKAARKVSLHFKSNS